MRGGSGSTRSPGASMKSQQLSLALLALMASRGALAQHVILTPITDEGLAGGAGCQWYSGKAGDTTEKDLVAATDFNNIVIGVDGRKIKSMFPRSRNPRAWQSGAGDFSVHAIGMNFRFLKTKTITPMKGESEVETAALRLTIQGPGGQTQSVALTGFCGA